MLAAVKLSVPAPSLVKPPVPLITDATVELPADSEICGVPVIARLPVIASDAADRLALNACTPVLPPPPLLIVKMAPALTFAATVTAPLVVNPVMPELLALSEMLPPVLIALLTITLLPASSESALAATELKPCVTVMSPTACNNTDPKPSWVATAPAVIVLAAVAKAPKASVPEDRSAVAIDRLPSMSGPVLTISRLAGSSSSRPVLPLGAERSELPLKLR